MMDNTNEVKDSIGVTSSLLERVDSVYIVYRIANNVDCEMLQKAIFDIKLSMEIRKNN